MTAFSREEHGMLYGIWGELETMNRSLTLLVELLENQEQERQGEQPTYHIADGAARRIAKAREDEMRDAARHHTSG